MMRMMRAPPSAARIGWVTSWERRSRTPGVREQSAGTAGVDIGVGEVVTARRYETAEPPVVRDQYGMSAQALPSEPPIAARPWQVRAATSLTTWISTIATSPDRQEIVPSEPG